MVKKKKEKIKLKPKAKLGKGKIGEKPKAKKGKKLDKRIEILDKLREEPRTKLKEEELQELISPRRAIDLKIQRHLEDLPLHFTALLLVEPTDYSRTNVELVRLFIDAAEKRGIYVTLNKSFQYLSEVLKIEGIDVSNIQFVDGITRGTGREELKAENCMYTESPNDLVALSMVLEEAYKKVEEQPAFLIFDSVSTLLIYNTDAAVERFIHSMIGKLREWKMKGIILMVKSEEQRGLIDVISQFCDKTVELT